MKRMRFLFCWMMLIFVAENVAAQEGYPIPSGPNQLFYLQKKTNKNTIVCEVNYKNGVADPDDPVHVFWMRYSDKGEKLELSFIQRKFAYGMKSKKIGTDQYELHFVSLKKYKMFLVKSADNKYHILTSINNKLSVLNRVYLEINGGTFWSPNVDYVELLGTDPASKAVVKERVKP